MEKHFHRGIMDVYKFIFNKSKNVKGKIKLED